MNRPILVVMASVIAALSIASVSMLSPVTNVIAQANTTVGAQESGAQFSANLTGELASPPVVTNATGTGGGGG
jgi:hypothetical protein